MKRLGIAIAVLLAGCARNPATGEREIMLVSVEQEIAMGREAAPQVEQQLGFIDDPEWARYVSGHGLDLAQASERPQLPWEFHVVDSPVVNAFALPGGFIYLTRGILAHMNSEAEMVGVLGHEIGHVTARHSAQQISQAQLMNVGLGLGMIFVPETRPFGDLLQTGMGLLFLKFGRDDETEADRLGVRYAANAGYDPEKMADFFDVFDRMQERSGQALPSWLSTHPNPENRQAKIREWAAMTSPRQTELVVGGDEFLRRLEGMVYGDDPREGYVDGNTFKHPDLRFQVTLPEGWNVENTKQAVYAGDENAAFQLTLASVSEATDPARYASDFFRRHRIETDRGRSLTIDVFPAFVTTFRARTQRGVVVGEACFLRDGPRMYELFAYTTSSRYRELRDRFVGIFESFSRLRDQEDLDVEPQRIRLYRVPRTMALRRALSESGVPDDQLEDLALLNQRYLDDSVEAGTRLKTVTEGRPVSTTSRPD